MTWQPVSFVEPILQHSYEDLDGCRIYLRTSGAGSVTVPITSPKPKPSFPAPLDYQLTEALALRAALIRDRQAAMARRDMRAVHEIEADIRDVVIVAMMGKGV